MRVLVALVVVLALFASCSFAFNEESQSRKRVASPYVFGAGHWIRVHEDKDVTEDHVIYLNILLKQQNLDKLDQLFWDVNDPSSINYGLFATKEQINALVAPPASVFEAILAWLGKEHLQVTQGADYIRVVTTVAEARRLFKTEFAFFLHPSTRTVSIGNLVEATIPSEIAEHVDFITGLGPQVDRKHMRLIPQRSRLDDGPSGVLVTPFVIQKYYNVQPTPANGTYNQAIAAFDDFFSLGALQEFDAFYNLTTNNVTVWGTDCLQQQCDQFESDLDVQYITSLGYGVPTIFHNTQPGWILEWAQDINNETNPPNIYSISYGWTEDEQCAVDPHFCKQNNFTSWTYVNRSEIELQKLATRGVTILIAAGDDGAPEYGGGGGNCPMDTSVYCTGTGCNYNSTQCGDLLLTNPRGVTCQFPGGISGDGCNHIMNENRFNPALKQFQEANAACGVTVEQDFEGNYWLYSNCSCGNLTLGNFHNLTFAEYTYNRTNGAPFTPDYPTSSAFVLSIGATQFSGDDNSVTGEIVCSVETGALITGGGGFSNQIAMPAWQQAIVSSWISSYGDSVPSGYFNPSGRGYPDLTLVGHNFDVYFSRNNSHPDSCKCAHTPVDGTSASTPSTAGLLSEVNQLLAASNLSPLGFANILLYTLDGSNFNDITVGNNRCNRAYCCLYGYNAVTGWDPASGLGSLNWTNFAKAVLDAKQAAADRRAALRN